MEGELCADGVDLGEVDADVALAVDDDVGAVAAAVAGPLVAKVHVVDVRVQLVRRPADQPAPGRGGTDKMDLRQQCCST